MRRGVSTLMSRRLSRDDSGRCNLSRLRRPRRQPAAEGSNTKSMVQPHLILMCNQFTSWHILTGTSAIFSIFRTFPLKPTLIAWLQNPHTLGKHAREDTEELSLYHAFVLALGFPVLVRCECMIWGGFIKKNCSQFQMPAEVMMESLT